MRFSVHLVVIAGAILAIDPPAHAQHLWWKLEGQRQATCLYGEITVLATQPGTYYCGANWHPGAAAGGYCGIQDNSVKERRTIFSIWDTSPQLHPHVSAAGPETIISRFTNEGSGAHTHRVWPWKIGETFQFYLSKEPSTEPDSVDAKYYIFDPVAKKWVHVATITSPVGGHPTVGTIAGSIASFLENFTGRDKDVPRLALYRLWLGTSADHLICLTRAGGDGTWGELHDCYFLAGGDPARIRDVLGGLQVQYGPAAFGAKGVDLEPIADRPLPHELIEELQHLPSAPAAPDK